LFKITGKKKSESIFVSVGIIDRYHKKHTSRC
jgi:hypothetical protein